MGQNESKVTLRIGGMSCASCVAHIETALTDLKGVSKARATLAAQKAHVGYEVAPDELTFKVLGMRSAHCEGVVRQGLENLPGVAKVEAYGNTGSATIWYHATTVSPGEIKQTIRDLGYDVAEKLRAQDALDR